MSCRPPWKEFLHGTICGLCGNSGEIDTRQTAVSPTGVKVGGLHWCICPNGRALAKQYRKGLAHRSDGTYINKNMKQTVVAKLIVE